MPVLSAATASGRQLYQGMPEATYLANPTTAPTAVAMNSGNAIPTGTYYIAYSWLNAAGDETALSPLSAALSVTLGQQVGINTPAFPAGAVAVCIYMNTVTTHMLKQTISGSKDGTAALFIYITNGHAVPLTALTVSAVQPTGTIAQGVYNCWYSFVNTTTGESLLCPLSTSFGVSQAGNKITVTTPTFPSNVASINIYIGYAGSLPTLQLNTTTSAGSVFVTTLVVGDLPPLLARTLLGSLLYTAPTTTTNVTAPSSTAYLTDIEITNVGSVNAGLTLFLVPAGAIPNLHHQFLNITNSTVLISSGDTRSITGLKILLSAGMRIYAAQTVPSSISLYLSGVEVQ
jgi:hypothetical protein